MRVATKTLPTTPPAEAHSSVVGGSTAKLRRLCNASRIEEKKVPRETSIYADTGTALHHVMETALTENLSNKKVLAQFSGAVLRIDDMEHDVTITPELLNDKVLPALAWFDETIPETAVVYYERKVTFDPEQAPATGLPRIEGAHGTADIIFSCLDTNRHGIADWKFGDFRSVSAEDNDQLRFYLCGAILSGYLPIVDEYEAWIFQPAASAQPCDYASKGVYTLGDLTAFAHDLADAIAAEPKHNPGPHCKDCKGRIVCQAYKQMLTCAVQSDVEGMTTHALAEALRMVGSVEAWAKQVKLIALRNAQAGLDIPGFTLTPTEGNRTWKDEQAAWGALGRLGLAADVRTVKATISPAQAEKKLKEIGTPAKDMERFLNRHVVRPSNGEKLVPAEPGKDVGALTRLAKAMEARGY
jgi:hypothetical protein